ncbi:MAG: hypothetical protein KJO55_07385, partial [Gammaproteobacteria bacterium]|nr:hypothetical protein [Gammaproteobacteria bacterium]
AESDPVAIERAGEVLADLGETIAHNLDAGRDGTTRFEGRATTRHLSRASLPAYRQFLERQGQAFLEKIDDWLSDHESDGSTTTRIGVGVYQVETDDDKEPKA